MSIPDGATPPGTVTPPASTPPTPPAATPPATEPEKVTLTKEAHDQLQKDAARGSTNQRKADLYDRQNKGKGHFTPAAPATPPTPEELAANGKAEDDKASRGLMALAADPAFREVLDADPTLRNLLLTNPLAVLPIYASDALDAEDAITLVKDALSQKAKPATPPAPPTPPVPPTPPAGGINPPGAKTPDQEYEDSRKNPNTEHAIAGMVKAGAKKLNVK